MSNKELPVISEAQFQNWANRYLRTYHQRVVSSWGNTDMDADMWSKLMKAASECKDIDINFYNIELFKVANLAEVNVDAKNVYGALRPLLEQMYRTELEEEPENIKSLTDVAFEDIEVVINPVVSHNRLSNANFSKEVESALTKSKHIWLTIESISAKLNITPSDWEDWVSKREDIVSRESVQTPGIHYYALSNRVHMPAYGTEEFKAYVLKIFNDNDKIWKSIDYIASQCYCKEAEEDKFAQWLFSLPELCFRVSKKEPDRYYFCLFSKLGVIPEEKEVKETGKNATGKNTCPDIEKGEVEGGIKHKKKAIKPVEWMMYAQLHVISDQFLRTMHFYANKIAMRDTNILSYFANTEKSLLGGLGLLRNELKIDDNNLPELRI